MRIRIIGVGDMATMVDCLMVAPYEPLGLSDATKMTKKMETRRYGAIGEMRPMF